MAHIWVKITLLALLSLQIPPLVLSVPLKRTESSIDQDNDDNDYVRQVLEEDQLHYGNNDNHQKDHYYQYNEYQHVDSEEGNQQQQQQQQQQGMSAAERQRIEEERLAQEQADRVAADREQQFQADLDRLDEESRKRAIKQKKKDRRRVQAVLKAASRNDLYGILGIRNAWSVKVPSRQIKIPFSKFQFTLPGVTLKETTDKDIRKHYRKRARQLHPDKNRDGRAQEAFLLVEEAAAVLSDPDQRTAYDEQLRQRRAKLISKNRALIYMASQSVWQVSHRVAKTAHTVLGPFFTSTMIILAIMI